MTRLNVYVPDELAERARERGLNVSALTQAAILAELEKNATSAWLAEVEDDRPVVSHEAILAALDSARDEFGR
ncbi:type II toxin-antitoxin system CcdA family antitoxin [Nocardia sp. NBC_00508]|uniref:type II toxin-antitoxin system CcdA family antitoxin n=1 Tax=Nocardia sp. NBC_00508 TaxID=2975992 RepID=UPI002E8183F3|nr:type II toxin-antitoxin system CcdA family antitoxin [Nocardia sp. NBC_00508]WUD69573.1 type II toxin-antitoxin system CcdA family antitoxin [Nocardia sp. NBC_00508]